MKAPHVKLGFPRKRISSLFCGSARLLGLLADLVVHALLSYLAPPSHQDLEFSLFIWALMMAERPKSVTSQKRVWVPGFRILGALGPGGSPLPIKTQTTHKDSKQKKGALSLLCAPSRGWNPGPAQKGSALGFPPWSSPFCRSLPRALTKMFRQERSAWTCAKKPWMAAKTPMTKDSSDPTPGMLRSPRQKKAGGVSGSRESHAVSSRAVTTRARCRQSIPAAICAELQLTRVSDLPAGKTKNPRRTPPPPQQYRRDPQATKRVTMKMATSSRSMMTSSC